MDTNTIMLMLQDKLPKDIAELQPLQEKLDNLSDSQRDDFVFKIPLLHLKSPALVFWVGSFLFGNFGVGRFMAGDMLLGALRLGLFIVYWITISTINIENIIDVPVFFLMLLLAIWIWWVVDLFLTGKSLRRKNLNKVIQLIDTL